MVAGRWMGLAVWGIWVGVAAAQGGDAARVQAVQQCGPAPVVGRDSQPNIFSDQQEMWLGKVESDLIESDVRPVRDAALVARLQRIADRLVATLPATNIQFKVMLVDSDEINGFSLAGGHVYILRKLAAAAQSDDELAGVIGHEIGHIISHQFAFETTREMKRLLNVTSVGDEADIRTKYESMLDAEYKDKHPELSETDQEQAEADRIGLYAMSAAGYRPQAFAGFWDRAFFLNGKTGSKLGDLFGMTKPSQKRLRSLGAMVAAVSTGCGAGNAPDRRNFDAWHDAVVANQPGAEGERTAALSEVTLTPPLRMELGQIKFSPNGKQILAQDESSVFVLDREPLAVRFRIDADGAMPANFSPDSESVTFSTPGLHTEQWSVAQKKLLSAHELLVRSACYDSRLSPDGRTLLCVEFDMDNWDLTLSLMDTTTSQVLWEKKHWLSGGYSLGTDLIISRALNPSTPFFVSSYSSDKNVLLFGGGDVKVAIDLRDRSVMKTGGNIRDSINGEYAFVGNDKVVGLNRFDPKASGVFSFPDGKKLQSVWIAGTGLSSVTSSGADVHVLGHGLKDYASAVEDLSTSKFLLALKTTGLDEYDGVFAGEAQGGAVVLAQPGAADHAQQKHVSLPLSPLPYYPPVALSKNGKYLAISAARRGGVWDVTTGKQVAYLGGFSDAAWSDAGVLYVDVPTDGEKKRHLSEVSMSTLTLKEVAYPIRDETHMRYGRLTDWKMDAKKKSWTLSLYDPATTLTVWSRTFPDRYFSYTSSFGHRDLIFSFELDSHTAKDALKSSPALTAEAQAVKDKKNARLIEVLDGENGSDVGSLVVELPPNYAGVDGLNRAGDLLYVAGVDDRTAVYAMSTGKQVRDLIGYVHALDTESGEVFTANRVGEGMVYDASGTERAHYQMGSPIRFAEFREDASQVTILTADETVHIMKVGEGGAAAAAE